MMEVTCQAASCQSYQVMQYSIGLGILWEGGGKMNAYLIGGSQNHMVIAESMTKALLAYEKQYGEPPNEIKLFSQYVIVDTQ